MKVVAILRISGNTDVSRFLSKSRAAPLPVCMSAAAVGLNASRVNTSLLMVSSSFLRARRPADHATGALSRIGSSHARVWSY